MARGEAILIAGPTASGKSALALRLAREVGGVVVNADAMQVYADLRVLTARPSVSDEAGALHRLYGDVDGAENYSVGRYREDAARVLAEITGSGRIPIVVGGTGLYFTALLDGLSDVPAVPEVVREAVRREAEGRTTPELHGTLGDVDPAMAARLRPSDRLRILRALEIMRATGRSLASFQAVRVPGPLAGWATRRIFLAPEREALRARIDGRFEAMVTGGALAEVEALARRGLDPALPVMRAHGVPALLAYLRGEITLGDAVARGQADTRAYVKRQFTWARHQLPSFEAVAPEQALASLAKIAVINSQA